MLINIRRTFAESQYRQDVMNAINLLLMQGHLPRGTEYALGSVAHPNHVILWLKDPRDITKFLISPRAYDPVDIINGASLNLKIIRGETDLDGGGIFH